MAMERECGGSWRRMKRWQSAQFQSKLPKNLRTEHALDRLTFGQRPGDAGALSKPGLKKWMELQLHPERIREDPLLEKRLQPLETLRLSPLEIWQRYPRQQKILAVLNGKRCCRTIRFFARGGAKLCRLFQVGGGRAGAAGEAGRSASRRARFRGYPRRR